MRRRVCGAVSITGALDMICDRPSTSAPERLTLVCLCGVTRDKGLYTVADPGFGKGDFMRMCY